MEPAGLGERIAVSRKEKGLTQAGLAELIGVSNKAVSRWETGEGYPDISFLVPLAKALDTDVDTLLGNEKRQEQKKSSYGKIAVIAGACAIALMVLHLLLWIVTYTVYKNGAVSETWCDLLTHIGMVIYIAAPVIGIVAGIVAAVYGLKEKENRYVAAGAVLLVVSVLSRYLAMIYMNFAIVI